ncbi:LpxI family protein [Ruegeria arenilitoris]|uniref:LpxI family protein n=1 Tax=Ruegeria arenilitoris TaxID=1173585 RepID=UPI00147D8DB9|nr:UDP-2,3-diacylglucosamine diphosphatase LpxI [Ruegeria arenilitoris]
MLALIAGTGTLPDELASQLSERPLICSLEGLEPENLKPDLVFPLEHLGSFIAELKSRGVTEICMAGAIERPAVDPSRIDAQTLPLVPIIQKAMMSGDDGALRAAISVFESVGLDVRSAHEIAPDIFPPSGCLTQIEPSKRDLEDADRAAAIVRAMGAADVGQACAVLNGQALAIESVFGTAWMLQSLSQRPDAGGGVLYKGPKPNQDMRVDIPTIGPETIPDVVAAGLAGIVIEKGSVIVLDRKRVISECDRMGIFLLVREHAA